MGFANEPGRTKWPSWVSVAPSLRLIHNHCSPIMVSLIQEQIVAVLWGHHYGKVWQQRGSVFADAKWTLFVCVTIFIDSVAAVYMKVGQGIFLRVKFSSFSVSLNFGTISEGKRMAARRSFTWLFKIRVPVDVRKPLCYHNIPKS